MKILIFHNNKLRIQIINKFYNIKRILIIYKININNRNKTMILNINIKNNKFNNFKMKIMKYNNKVYNKSKSIKMSIMIFSNKKNYKYSSIIKRFFNYKINKLIKML